VSRVSNRSVPEAAVIPELPYPDVRQAAEWLTRAFGFKERLQIRDHRAQLVFESGAVIAIKGDAPGSTLLVRVADADAHHAQAASAGARILSEPEDYPYGERQYMPSTLAGTAGRSRSRSPTSTQPNGVER
jgi:uncharacterized glyoxalase superfamily protein PhnB